MYLNVDLNTPQPCVPEQQVHLQKLCKGFLQLTPQLTMTCLTAWLMRVKPSEAGLQLAISPHLNLWPWGCSCVGYRANHHQCTFVS